MHGHIVMRAWFVYIEWDKNGAVNKNVDRIKLNDFKLLYTENTRI